MDLGIKGKTALITGGSSGIGYAVAECLVDEGANVVIASRSFEHLERAVKLLKRVNPTVGIHSKVLDLSQEEKVRKAVSEVLAQYSIDILVHNVGGPPSGSVMELSLQDWDKGYATLVRHLLLLSQAVIPRMKDKGWGRILTITSTSAKEIIPQLPISGVFRSGLSSLTKSLAREVGRSGVLVNNLLPGPTNTERLKDLEEKSPAFFKGMKEETAVGRIAEPQEIARIAAFLCSAANSYITGTDVLADGGYTKAF